MFVGSCATGIITAASAGVGSGSSGSAGTTATNEQVRTVLDLDLPHTFAAQSLSERRANGQRLIAGCRQLADVVTLTSRPIAGCSLAVNIAGGPAERQRPFSLLRLAGTPLKVLGRVITLESVAPLLIITLTSIGAGLLTAHLFYAPSCTKRCWRPARSSI